MTRTKVDSLPVYSKDTALHESPSCWGRLYRWLLVSLAALTVLAIFASCKPTRHLGRAKKARNPAYLVKAMHGAVASENRLCSDIGVDVLKLGGNAVDAAIATTFCIGVVNMFSWVNYLAVRIVALIALIPKVRYWWWRIPDGSHTSNNTWRAFGGLHHRFQGDCPCIVQLDHV